MSKENLKLWESVEETDPSFTRDGQIGLTTINAQYMFRRATEMFGVVGIGWGYEILEERYDEGKPFFLTEKVGQEVQQIQVSEKNHTLKIKFWAKIDGEKSEVTQYGHTKYFYKSKYGATVDEEAPKKSLTDALKKSLSLYGFSADVYLGYFDDVDYVKETREKHEIEKADNSEEVLAAKREEFIEWFEGNLKTLGKIPNKVSLKVLWVKLKQQTYSRCRSIRFKPDNYIEKLKDAYETSVIALEKKEQDKGESNEQRTVNS